jgi:hypothetical protein
MRTFSGTPRSSGASPEHLENARQRVVHYGHELDEVVYIPAMAVIGRSGLPI